MYTIKTLNQISQAGLSKLPEAEFLIDPEAARPEGIILRSFDMHSMELNDNLLGVARAGAGTNNIPIDKCTEMGIPVFNTPGANANAVKELVLAGLLVSSRRIINGAQWVQTLTDNENVEKAVEAGKKQFIGPEIAGKTLGVIGLGAIGLVAAIIWWLRRDIPESPRWLAVRGRYDEADAIVKQLEANGSEPIDAAAKADTSDTRNAGGRSLGICLLVAVVAVAATNVCSYAFTSWVPTILVKRGINLSSSLLTSTVMMLGAPVGCLIGSLLIDRIGRKRTIVPAFLFTGVFGLMYAFQTSTVSAIIVGFLLMMCLYVLMASVVAV